MAPTAVLLAFDGVLADTENYHVAAWQRTLSRLGWDVPDEVAARSIDIDDYTFAAEVFARRAVVQADLDGWVARKRALTLEMARFSPRLFPGAAELVKGLAGRVRLAVTADARREVVEAVLGGARLLDQIELIVAADDVKEVRPDPECLRLAVKRLKLKPSSKTDGSVLAVEGTPAGLRAARLAKVSALAVSHRRSCDDWIDGAPCVSGLQPVDGLLARIGFPSEP